MDPLALLSGDEDDAEGEEAEETTAGPDAKRARTVRDSSDGGTVDFAALRRVGYSAFEKEEEQERSRATASLQSCYAALSEASQALQTPGLDTLDRSNGAQSAADTTLELGCELPPDSIEVFDDQGLEKLDPWTTFEAAEAAIGGLDARLVQGMRDQGFSEPTPIQASTWPILAAGRDLIGVAKTGSGKTLAFLLPFFSQLLREGLKQATGPEKDLPVQMLKQAAGPGAYSPDILVLAPSRELAVQIETEANRFTSAVGISGLACYGGEGLRKQQLGVLRTRPQCVVGTIGRLNDFIDNEKHWFGVKNVRFLILDEADHMIGEGLNAPIRKLTCDVETPRRQTGLFSATFAEEVTDLATWITRHAVEVRVGMKDPLRANRDVDQRIMIVKDDLDREGAAKTLLRKQYAKSAANPGKILIFASDPEECESLALKLKTALNHANVQTLHGNKKQAEREKAMSAFRSGDAPLLVATGIAGRGLDVKDIQVVLNYDPPEDGQDYVHRIGRTGRAGNKGIAYTLLRKGPDGRAMIFIAQVMRRTGLTVPKELIDALKQRRGRDMSLAAEALQGLCAFEKVDRSWAKEF